MTILTISGSSRSDSSNVRLLGALPALSPEHQFKYFEGIHHLPLFQADLDQAPWPVTVLQWRKEVQYADALIISTPEYIHNIPASIKNALEWITSSGELADKRTLPITFTPLEPRGEKAMQSLLWSLQALKAQIIGQLPLYQNEIDLDSLGSLSETGASEMLREGIRLLEN
jgi:NAD(P)H-dependent FMN reductase